ncbi:MAG: tRNA (adenosine(37)-N6)-threonylcarbamoyltransferase complex dimerization subunit type 1 TsaB [Mariniphaga sp.]
MALILNIESSTEVCSVSLALDGKEINLRENTDGQNHAMLLTVFINELFEESKVTADKLDAVAVSGGPGSYTGLRIGVSVAKGICYGSKLPLIAVTSLEAMADYVIRNLEKIHAVNNDQILFCPMIDARRMEVFTAFYNKNCKLIRGIQADIIDHQSYFEYLENNIVLFFGNGSSKCRETINHPNALFIPDIITSSRYMIPLSEREFKSLLFSDVAYYEPFYLKDFVATVPLKNIIKSGSIG